MLVGAGNLAYRLAFNSMLKGATAVTEMSQRWSIHECKQSDYRGPVAAAIAAGDETRAEAITRDAMRAAIALLEAHVKKAEPPAAPSTPNTQPTTAAKPALRTRSKAR